VVHISVPDVEMELQVVLRAAMAQEEPFPLPDQLRVDAIRQALPGWDASVGARRDAAADAAPPGPAA